MIARSTFETNRVSSNCSADTFTAIDSGSPRSCHRRIRRQASFSTQSPIWTTKRRIDYSHRKRVVGGFYAYEHHTEFADLGELCAGRTDSRGLLLCEPKVEVAGNVYLLAEARDAQGNVAPATSYWVAGSGGNFGDTWFTAGNQDRMDVIPEKRSYAPGEKARLQVRLPFREATALVSVEADGVIDTFVQPLSRYKPYIDLPVKAEWGPNVFVSVLAVRGRVQPVK